MIYTATQIETAIRACARLFRPVMIWGRPGVGKSDLMRRIARAWAGEPTAAKGEDYYLKTKYLASIEPADLGLPIVNTTTGRTSWTTPEWWITEEDVTAGKAPKYGMVFLDDIAAAAPSVQVVAYGMVHERKAPSGASLAPGWLVIGAGNRVGDGAVSNRMSSALANRMLHFDMDSDADAWCAWGLSRGSDEAPAPIKHSRMPRAIVPAEVMAFIRFRPALLHAYAPGQLAFPSPRTWEMVCEILALKAEPATEAMLVQAAIGEAAGAQLSVFLRMYRTAPNIDAILLNPDKAPVPAEDESGMIYTVAYALASRATAKNLPAVMTYLERLPEEYNTLAVKYLTNRDTALSNTPEFIKWAVAHSDILS